MGKKKNEKSGLVSKNTPLSLCFLCNNVGKVSAWALEPALKNTEVKTPLNFVNCKIHLKHMAQTQVSGDLSIPGANIICSITMMLSSYCCHQLMDRSL